MSQQKSKKKFKRKVEDPAYLGLPKPLPMNQLPLNKDVGLAYEEYLFNDEEYPIHKVTDNIIEIYKRASIPTIHKKKIHNKVQNLIQMKKQKLKDLREDPRRGHASNIGKFRKKCKNGKVKAKLEDVLNNIFAAADEANIPPLELSFYEDQKSIRKQMIWSVDVVTTKKNERKCQKLVRKKKGRQERKGIGKIGKIYWFWKIQLRMIRLQIRK